MSNIILLLAVLRLVGGTSWCPAGNAVKAKLERAGVPFEYIDAEGDKMPEKAMGCFRLPALLEVDANGHVIAAQEQLTADTKVPDLKPVPGGLRKNGDADGLALVEKANAFREKKDFAGGEAFLAACEKPSFAPAATTEGKQAVLMARFALYREDASKKEEMNALLRKVEAMDPKSFWGIAATGWLDQPNWLAKARARRKLFAEELAKVWVTGKAAPVTEAQLAKVRGLGADTTAGRYLVKTVGEANLAEIASWEGGEAFLRSFFGDEKWLEAFCGSGPWFSKPWHDKNDHRTDGEIAASELKVLAKLAPGTRHQAPGTAHLLRTIATALALDHGGDWTSEKLAAVFADYRRWAQDGTLVTPSLSQDVHAWREVLAFGQNDGLPEKNLTWIHDFAFVPPPQYAGICWKCQYRAFNCFGDTVQPVDWEGNCWYYSPWDAQCGEQEMRYRVGGVCGALSKFGSHAAASHGIRSVTAGQPIHCAYLIWSYTENRWTTAYSVMGHTQPHFTLGGRGFAALEEQERYFANPRRMEAERLRWEGRYDDAVRLIPGNYQAADEWRRELGAKCEVQGAECAGKWDEYGEAVLAGFATMPSEGWDLYLTYLDHLADPARRLAAAEKGLRTFREFKAKTDESPYFDEIALNPLYERFVRQGAAPSGPPVLQSDAPVLQSDAPVWQLFESALAGAAGSPSFYRQAIDWGAARLMTDHASSDRFLAIVGASAERTGEKLDFAKMVRKASESGDAALFAQVNRLMAKLAPDALPKRTGKDWPREDYGSPLVSADGFIQTSTTCNWDNPELYAQLLDPVEADYKNAFHTANESNAWVTVVLKGETEVTGVTVVNSGESAYNRARQDWLTIWTSDNGRDWKWICTWPKAQDVWKVKFPQPMKAKYVRIGRKRDKKQDFFHLHKVLIYGRKLY